MFYSAWSEKVVASSVKLPALQMRSDVFKLHSPTIISRMFVLFDCLAVCPSPCFQDDACKTLDISLGVPWMCWRMGSLASWSCREMPFLLPSGRWEMHLAFPWRIWPWEDFHKVLFGHVEINFATSFPHQSQMNIFRCIALPSWYVSKILSEFNLQKHAWPWFFARMCWFWLTKFFCFRCSCCYGCGLKLVAGSSSSIGFLLWLIDVPATMAATPGWSWAGLP